MKEKHVYVFFNCDEEKNQSTMNVFYNNTFYGETKKAKKELFAKIKSELEAGKIQIAEENLAKVEAIVTAGEPTEASQYITYGTIESFVLK